MDRFDTPREALDYRRVARALAYLDAHYRAQPTLAELAGHVGLSEAHLSRAFSRLVGIGPKRFLQQRTARRARELLRADANVIEAAAALGLSGGGRLHDLMVTTEALSPGQVKSAHGVCLRQGSVDTPLGTLLVVASPRGICEAHFLDSAPDERALAARWPGAHFERDPAPAHEVAACLFGDEGLAARRPLSVLLRGTPFQLQVWCALLTIPCGERLSYGELALGLGRPRSTRAVASAVGRNPLALLVPCHRVVQKTGALGGYRWGLERKRVRLCQEAAALEAAGT